MFSSLFCFLRPRYHFCLLCSFLGIPEWGVRFHFDDSKAFERHGKASAWFWHDTNVSCMLDQDGGSLQKEENTVASSSSSFLSTVSCVMSMDVCVVNDNDACQES